ncbi:MAG: uroporphyrinogen-III C-methyltransferase [Clostridiales bacterium]|jgi:uroporphyrinogen III methyltransferase/synthase|nr:uroporphyrinogen-III C-methyltransferase [Clostridiales bacterium]
MSYPNGKVWLVGAGPGDSGLLTLKGKQILEQGEVILYDSLVGEGILAWMPDSAEKIPVGKRVGRHHMAQEEINLLLLEKAKAGKRVVRLKGGDPFLFGRGGEELELLAQHRIPFEVVPGVSSAIAVPAYQGIPVTHRDFCSSLHIITGHKKQDSPLALDYPTLAKLPGTLVFLMGVHALPEICQGLLQAGMAPHTPASLLEHGTLASQRAVHSTLERLPADAKAANIAPPAVLVIGSVCALHTSFSWVSSPTRPLGDIRVIVTRPRNRASALSQQLRELGAEVVELPSIQTIPLEPTPQIERMLNRLPSYHWMLFTSAAGVEAFFSLLQAHRVDIRRLAHAKFAAIGPATQKAIEQHGILVDCVPTRYDGEALAQALLALIQPGETVCIPRAQEGTPSLTQALTNAGVAFDDVPVYQIKFPHHRPLTLCKTDLVAFTSASTVKGFVQTMAGTDFRHLTAICIGEQTAQEARKYAIKTVVAKQATIASLVDCLLEFHRQRKEEAL